MNKVYERVFSGALILFLLVYVGYQAYRYYYNPYKTEAVFEYSVAHSVKAQGIAVRREKLIEGVNGGIENCIYDDAAWVSVGEPVIEFYRDRADDAGFRRMREIEAELLALESAQSTAVNSFSHTESLSRDIKEQLDSLVTMASTGRFDDVASVRPAITTLINKRQISTGKEWDFSDRIETLKAEQASLRSITGPQSVSQVAAPVSGYFVRGVDGLESLTIPDVLKEASLGDLERILSATASPVTFDTLGKIVTGPQWDFVARLPKYDAQWLVEGREADLLFDVVAETIPARVVRVVQDKNEEDAIVVLRTDIVSDELLNLRYSEVAIQFRRHSGLRINTSAIRFQGDERGVFVLNGNEVRFKKIDPVYEESSFILSLEHTDPGDTEWVRMFDLVLTGADLYDGKIIE